MKTKLIILSIILIATGLYSCDEDIVSVEKKGKGEVLISTLVPSGSSVHSGSAFMQLINNFDPSSYTNGSALPISYGLPPMIIGNDIFILPGWGNETNILKKYSKVDGKIVAKGTMPLPEKSQASNMVAKGDIAYIACTGIGKILVINHKKLTKIKEIDISSYGVDDKNPDPSSMLIRNNHLFVTLQQMVGGFFPKPNRPFSDVIIIDTDKNEVLKMITHKSNKISCPSRPIDPHSIFMDEQKDIYIVCVGAWGRIPGHNAGILRIKAGQTEFDKNYNFVFNTTNVSGESNAVDYIHSVRYAGNGKMYGTANFPAYYSKTPNYLKDRTVVPAVIDLAAKTISTLGMSYSNNFGVSVGTYKDKIVFGLATKESNGFFVYEPATKKGSKEAVVKLEGNPFYVYTFK